MWVVVALTRDGTESAFLTHDPAVECCEANPRQRLDRVLDTSQETQFFCNISKSILLACITSYHSQGCNHVT